MAERKPSIPIEVGSHLKFSSIERVFDSRLNAKITFWGLPEFPALEKRSDDIDLTVESNMRMDRLAYRYYGDSMLWWIIALRNNIELPAIGLYPGRTIVIPSPSYVKSSFLR